MEYSKYTYEGPVVEFGKCVANNWTGTTYATSEKKAKANLTYQFKKQYNRDPSTRVELPGKIMAS